MISDDDIKRLRDLSCACRGFWSASKAADSLDALLAERERRNKEIEYTHGRIGELHDQVVALMKERDTAWAALNDRREQMDHLKAALNERQRELLTWERRYKDLAAEMVNAVALRAPAPIVITAPPGDGAFDLALDRIADMLKGDDGQARKEAEKFLARHRPPAGDPN